MPGPGRGRREGPGLRRRTRRARSGSARPVQRSTGSPSAGPVRITHSDGAHGAFRHQSPTRTMPFVDLARPFENPRFRLALLGLAGVVGYTGLVAIAALGLERRPPEAGF